MPHRHATELPLDTYYVDGARTHEVFATVEKDGNRVALVIVERPCGSTDAREAMTRRETFDEAWEAVLSLREYEAKLAASGAAYARYTARGGPEGLPVRPRVDADFEPERTALAKDGKSAIAYKHFYQHASGKSRLDLAVPRVDLDEERYVLATFDFRFPDVDRGDLRIVHARLAPTLLKHAWVEMQIELAQTGYRRLTTPIEYTVALGPDWRERWNGAWKAAVRRLLAGDVGSHEPKEAPRALEAGPSLDAVLASPLVAAVAKRHLAQGEERTLAASGELAIHRFIATRRKSAHHDEQVELSLLEAALMARYQRSRGKMDAAREEGARAARLVAAMGDAERYLYLVSG